MSSCWKSLTAAAPVLESRPAAGALAVIGLVFAAKVVRKVVHCVKKRKTESAMAALKKDVVHIFSFPRWSQGACLSAPCLRLEAFLRLAKVPYEIHFVMDSSASPTGRLPYMVYNGFQLADSEFIAQWITAKFNIQVDKSLTPKDHAIGLAARRLVESSLSFGCYRSTIVDNLNSVVSIYSELVGLPRFVVGLMVKYSMRKATIKMLNLVGHGDLTDAQYRSEMLRDLKALETLIGDNPYLLGKEPSSYDCNVYGLLQPFSAMNVETREFAYVRDSKVLMGYIRRVEALLFPDMKAIVDNRSATTQTFSPAK